MDGLFIVDKHQGLTSQDVCFKLKKMFKLNKCGHSGTLDPDTTGVLVVAVNQATKLLKLINEHDKTYITTIVFGYDSDTLDVSGKILIDEPMKVSKEALDKALDKLKNSTLQIPPMVSAIKVNGKKLYQYAREGITLEVEPRKVKISELKILSDLRMVNNHFEIDIMLHVSKGFYVRSFARDLGKELKGCAIMKSLRRITSGNFSVDQAKTLEEITEKDLLAITDVFKFQVLDVNDYVAHLALNGVVFDERQIITDEPFYVSNNGKIIAIYEVVGVNKYKPVLIFQ